MKNGPDALGSGFGGEQGFVGQIVPGRPPDALGLPARVADRSYGLERSNPAAGDRRALSSETLRPSMSLNDADPGHGPATPGHDAALTLHEPAFPPVGWLDDTPSGPLADHPLLRGLLLELPAKTAAPTPEWLDRWFEAARSILELLYDQQSASSHQRR